MLKLTWTIDPVVIGFVGNIATLMVISCWNKLHTSTFTMLACVAISDTHTLLQIYLWEFTPLNFLLMCKKLRGVLKAQFFLLMVADDNTWMQLCLFAVLRYIAIVYPIAFQTRYSPRRVVLLSACGWILVFMLCGSKLILNIYVSDKYAKDIWLIIHIFRLIFPTTLFITLHYLKFKAIRRSQSVNTGSALRMHIIVFMVLLTYVITALSYLIQNIQYRFELKSGKYAVNPAMTIMINCMINPLIYVFASPPITHMILKMKLFCLLG